MEFSIGYKISKHLCRLTTIDTLFFLKRVKQKKSPGKEFVIFNFIHQLLSQILALTEIIEQVYQNYTD